MSEYVNALILGVVEGITEFLPVSSTGHLLIAESLLNCRQSDAFNVLIQVGPIVAVTLVFWKRIVALITGLGDLQLRNEAAKLAVSFLLTCAGGFAAKLLGMELPETVLPVAVATLAGGGIILWIERRVKGRILGESVTWTVACAVAAGQLLAAVFPGTSRSGAAVMAALLLGMSRPAAVRFAFLVGIPTMFAAGALELMKAIRAGEAAELIAPPALIAFGAATLAAWLSVAWLLKFVQTRTFVPFAWYRLLMGGVMLALMSLGIIR